MSAANVIPDGGYPSDVIVTPEAGGVVRLTVVGRATLNLGAVAARRLLCDLADALNVADPIDAPSAPEMRDGEPPN